MSRFDGTTQSTVTEAAIGNGTRRAPPGSIFVAVRGMSLHNEIRIVRPSTLMTFNQDVKAVTPLDTVDGRFLHYAMLARVPDLRDAVEAAGHGTGVLPTDRLSDLPIPDLPLIEQLSIASILGALDDKIELNRRMNETLEAMARAIFKDWFVDFGPTLAKMEGRAPYLAPDLWLLFPDRLNDEGKPQGWEVMSIYECANVIYGAPFSSKLFGIEKIGQPLIRIRDLVSEDPGVWTSELHPKGYKVKLGDIVVGMDGEFRAYLWGGCEAWLNQRVCVFAPKPGYTAAFVRNSILEPLAQVEATEIATTVIHLGKNDIDRFQAIYPTQPLLERYNSLCQPLYDAIVANKQASRTLAETRDLLLPKLMSGEIWVRDAETLAEAAL